eukprot:353592-Chlamydomonas_euryale.AAC.2
MLGQRQGARHGTAASLCLACGWVLAAACRPACAWNAAGGLPSFVCPWMSEQLVPLLLPYPECGLHGWGSRPSHTHALRMPPHASQIHTQGPWNRPDMLPAHMWRLRMCPPHASHFHTQGLWSMPYIRVAASGNALRNRLWAAVAEGHSCSWLVNCPPTGCELKPQPQDVGTMRQTDRQ